MKAAHSLGVLAALALCAAALGACSAPIDPGGDARDEEEDLDPLTSIPDEVTPGSLDDLYRKVIQPSCAGQAGLCHSGQFEPNLSTPALAYANLVERPGIEKRDQLRVVPGDPAKSLLVDKLRDRDVISVMPLGAKPLSEEDIQAVEAWIVDGAKRFPDASPPERIDQPPEEPVLGIFDEADVRLDVGGSVAVQPGDRVVFRMTTHDFETPDEEVPLAAFMLETQDGGFVLIGEPGDPSSGYASLDTSAPPALGEESFNWSFTWEVPETADVYLFETGLIENRPLSGESFILLGYYMLGDGADYTLALSFELDAVRVQR
jgi:hypothetical protein